MRRLNLIITGFLIVAGCHPDQDKERHLYRSQTKLSSPTTQISTLTLREAMLRANEYHESLAISGENYLRSLIERRRAVAEFLPTVNLSPSYSFRQQVDSAAGSDGNSSSNAQSRTFDAGVSGSINLFNGFSDINRYWRDTFAIEQARQNLLDAQQGLLLDVASVFYEVLRAEASVKVIDASLVTQEERLRDIQGRLDAGLARPLDVAQTQSQVSATRVRILNASRDVITSRLTLSFLTTGDFSTMSLADSYDIPQQIAGEDEFRAIAYQQRPDLAAADAAVKAARRDVQVAFGQYYPSVTLDLEGFLYRESLPDERKWQGLLSLNLPLFSAGRIEADVREAWSFYRQAMLVQQRLGREIDRDIQSTFAEIIASDSRLLELKVQRDAAQQAYDQADQSYRAGLATNLDRVTAQSILLQAQLDQSNEFFDRKLRQLQLLRTAGVLRDEVERMQ